jgi:hypothetical protein
VTTLQEDEVVGGRKERHSKIELAIVLCNQNLQVSFCAGESLPRGSGCTKEHPTLFSDIFPFILLHIKFSVAVMMAHPVSLSILDRIVYIMWLKDATNKY